MGTVCAIILVTLVVGLNVWRLVWNRKRGKATCSGCSGCCGKCGGKCKGTDQDHA